MAPKGDNAKKESGRAKKAENKSKKQEVAAAEKERKEADNWDQGAKSNKAKEEREVKRREDLARKAENARLLAEEEAAVASRVKTTPKAGAKKAAKAATPAGPGAIAAGGDFGKEPEKSKDTPEKVESFATSGIDNALDLLEVVNAKTDKASVGQQAAGIERHPERRFKAAFEAYKETELPNLKVEHPGLRLQQYHDILYKQFQKSPDNPFNQVTVAYDASKEERTVALKEKHEAVQKKMRVESE
ncbi:hypothetical protein L210DRAFT_3622166 [Boletus edulis BED1]|uniref:DUF1014-domain-containing protein n=1 Tax=Boletus edulis BED1 TaxID=1328754 RepID=A0AAD4BQM8_BOLED|nr:hypothetical protein L210DRAFT_3622166 [Boletus edulis BED1]